MKYIRKYSDSILSKLLSSTSSDWYRFLGPTNGGEWMDNLTNILYKKTIKTDELISDIDDILSPYNKDEKLRTNPVEYPELKNPVNSRFSNCWFLDIGWDICVQFYEDEWILVSIGDGQGRFNFWYLCDQIDGFEKLVDDIIK